MLPILYSFRRCPYAMRARMAIVYAGVAVELREVLLKDKPAALIAISTQGTVPVLQLNDGRVIEQSLEVMHWALQQKDPLGLLSDVESMPEQVSLIDENDGQFKHWLDRYKYHVGYPEHSQIYYREQAETFLQTLEQRLQQSPMLFSDRATLADVAIFPFVRQFAMVDMAWFETSEYQQCYRWLHYWLAEDSFQKVMQKYSLWNGVDNGVRFGNS